MKPKNWTSKEKLQIVLEGLKEKITMAELCNKYGMHQSQYYRWREQLLEHGIKSFEVNAITSREKRAQAEINRLKRIIGDLTVELKKNEYDL